MPRRICWTWLGKGTVVEANTAGYRGWGLRDWALVESHRTAKGSRQRVVAYLGELKPSERTGWAELGRRLDRKQRPQPSLFDPPAVEKPADDEPVLVNLKGVRLERLRDFGDAYLARGLWRPVGLDLLLEQLLPQGRQDGKERCQEPFCIRILQKGS